MEGQSVISPDVLARYAADAAREVPGVAGLAESPLHRGKAVELSASDGATGVTLHLELEWGRSAKDVAGDVQRRVREYLERMTDTRIGAVDVVFEGVGAPPAKR